MIFYVFHAATYSLVGTCRRYCVEPEAWLLYVLTHIQEWPVSRPVLLPWKINLTSPSIPRCGPANLACPVDKLELNELALGLFVFGCSFQIDISGDFFS